MDSISNTCLPDVDPSVEADEDACRNLQTISSPTWSDGYFDSPRGSPAEEDIGKKHGSDEKMRTSTGVALVGDEGNHSEEESWLSRPLVSTQLFPDTVATSDCYADDIPPEIATNNAGISPFTRELITRSRQEMERRRQKRILSSSQTSPTEPSISDLSIPEDPPTRQYAAALPADRPDSPRNPFDNASLIAEYFHAGGTSIDDPSHVKTNGSDDEALCTNAEVVHNDIIAITGDKVDAQDSELPARTVDVVMELDHVSPESSLLELEEVLVPADAPESWPDHPVRNDGDYDQIELEDMATNYDVAVSNVDADITEDSELTPTAIGIAVVQSEQDPTSMLPELTETQSDDRESWPDQPQSNDNDFEQTDVQDTTTNFDLALSNVDNDATEESKLTAANITIDAEQNDYDPTSTLLGLAETQPDDRESFSEQLQSSDDDEQTEVQDTTTNCDVVVVKDSELAAANVDNVMEQNDHDSTSMLLELTETPSDDRESWLEQVQSSDSDFEQTEAQGITTNFDLALSNVDDNATDDSKLTAANIDIAVEKDDHDPTSMLLGFEETQPDNRESSSQQLQSSDDDDEHVEVQVTTTNCDVVVAKDSELAAANVDDVMGQNDHDSTSMLLELTETQSDDRESWLEHVQSSDSDFERTEVQDITTNFDLALSNVDNDATEDSKLTAANINTDVEKDDHDPTSMLLGLAETQPNDRESSSQQLQSSDDHDEHVEVQDTTTNCDVVVVKDSELAAANIDNVVGQNDHDSTSMLLELTETQSDDRESWLEQGQTSDDDDDEQTGGQVTTTNGDVVVTKDSELTSATVDNALGKNDHDPTLVLLELAETPSDDLEPWHVDVEDDEDTLFTATNNEFIIGINDSGNDASATPSRTSQRDARNHGKSLGAQNHPSTTSLDFDAVFKKRNASGTQESSRPFTNSSMSFSRLVFGDQHDPCCVGRRGWLLFLVFVVLLVILIAALVGKQSSSSSSSVVFTTRPSSAPSSELSSVPTMKPSSAPSVELSSVPTKEPSNAPSTEPSNQISFSPSTSLRPSWRPTAAPSAPTTPAPVFPLFPFTLTFPPYNWPSVTNAPVSLAAPIARAPPRLASQSPAATPTTGGAFEEVPPYSIPVSTFPPFAPVRPSGRNLRSREATEASSELAEARDRLQQHG